ncbi:hypothetical protein GCM10027072_23510 [Streptomyces bullii]
MAPSVRVDLHSGLGLNPAQRAEQTRAGGKPGQSRRLWVAPSGKGGTGPLAIPD